MSISGINSSSFDSLSIGNTLNKQMQPAADLLGMTVSQMQTAERSGQTLSSLAKSKGISEVDLESAVSEGLQQNTPAGGTPLTADQASTLATAIATGKTPSTALTFANNMTLLDYIQQDENTNSANTDASDVLDSSDGTAGDASEADSFTQALAPSGSNTSGLSLEALAKALGTDTATLQQQLQSGDTTSLAQELTSAYGTTAGLQFDASL